MANPSFGCHVYGTRFLGSSGWQDFMATSPHTPLRKPAYGMCRLQRDHCHESLAYHKALRANGLHFGIRTYGNWAVRNGPCCRYTRWAKNRIIKPPDPCFIPFPPPAKTAP